MAAQPVLEPLMAAGLTAILRPDRRLAISPEQRITAALDAHIRAHRDELIAALSAVPAAPSRPTQWPPPEPPWRAGWMERDDYRRAEIMSAEKARLRQRGRA
jgi:hypothetical protein